jgi:hypothetical protein
VSLLESKAFLEEQLSAIEQWEKEQKDLWFWEKIGRLPFQWLDRLTPKFVHDKLGQLLDEVGHYIQTGGQYLVNKEHILRLFSETEPYTIEDIRRLPLAKMDEVCDQLIAKRQTFAKYQGATTGFGGIFTLAIDIPALLGLALKTLQEIALAYGFDPHDKQERMFIVKCLQFALSDIVGKKAILDELFTTNRQQTLSQLQGWREVVWTFRDQYGWKKLFQAIPIAGVLFGAWMNKTMISDIAEAGKMLYRKRRIIEKLAAFQ